MPVFSVHHTTVYRYKQPVAFGEHRMMLRPLDGPDQRLLRSELRIDPQPAALRWIRDPLGNSAAAARFAGRAAELRIESVVQVEVLPSHPDGFGIEDDAQTYPFAYSAEEMPILAGFMQPRGEPAARDWARQFLRPGRQTPSLDLLAAMAQSIRRNFAYERRMEKGIQAPGETLRSGRGSCRDFTVLMIEAVRSLGLAARFVTGYLYVPSRDRQGLHGGGSTHAWLQVYLPGAGWIDFDPTNAIVGNSGLIRVAVAREPAQAVPLFGTYTGFRSDDLGMDVTVHVTRETLADTERIRSGGIA